jgi:DNA polymerase V
MLRIKKQATKRDVLGFRLPMVTHEEPTLDITDITVIDPDNTYYMRMGSDAMTSYHILKDHVLVIDRALRPIPGSIVVFYHEGGFYTREYVPETDRVLLRAGTENETIIIDKVENWICWGVVTITLNPVLRPAHRNGRYARVCAC